MTSQQEPRGRTDEERAYYSYSRRVYAVFAHVYDAVVFPFRQLRHDAASMVDLPPSGRLVTFQQADAAELDGGHIANALFGRARAAWIGKVALGGMVVLGLFVWPGLISWALIVYFIAGRPGIPPLDDVTALDGPRRTVGWFAYGLLALILLPLPHALSSTFGLHCPYL